MTFNYSYSIYTGDNTTYGTQWRKVGDNTYELHETSWYPYPSPPAPPPYTFIPWAQTPIIQHREPTEQRCKYCGRVDKHNRETCAGCGAPLGT